MSSSSCCIRRADSDGYKNPNRNLQLQLNTDGPIKYVEVLGGDMLSQSQSFRSCLSPVSEFSDFTLFKPSSTTDFKEIINVLDASLPDSAWTFESQQRLLIEIKDNGVPVQSATVTVNILLEDGIHEPISDHRQKTAETSKRNMVKCVRNSMSSSSCCIRRADSDGYKNPNRNLQLQLNTDGPIKYVEVLGGDMLSQSQSFRSCLSPVSEFSDFTLFKPSSTTDFKEMINVLDASLPDSAWTFESQQCVRNSMSSSSCCIRRADSDGYKNPNRNLQLQLNTDGPIKYVEVLGGDMLSQSQSFRSCLSPVSEFSDFTLVKPSSTTDFKEMINVLDASLPDSAWTFESQQVSP
ncbi:unnamed protein product [Coregonus sp. 'balchen']|nr:unnamed protein product [Coregonus sp. 'balchen']